MFLFFKGENILKKEELNKIKKRTIFGILLGIIISFVLLKCNLIVLNIEKINEFVILLIGLSFVIVFGGIAFVIVFMDKRISKSLFKDGRYDYVFIRTQITIFIASLLLIFLFVVRIINIKLDIIKNIGWIKIFVKSFVMSLLMVKFYNLMYSIKGFFQILLISKTYDTDNGNEKD